jgi:hypothetical protein
MTTYLIVRCEAARFSLPVLPMVRLLTRRGKQASAPASREHAR